MRSFAYPALLALPLALAAAAAPASAQDRAPFTGARVEGLLGWDRVQNDGHSDALMYGAQAGYDVQASNNLVAGIEGEVDGSNNKVCAGSFTAGNPRTCAEAGRDFYVGARIGTAISPATLLYAKAGYTNARINVTADNGATAGTIGQEDLGGYRVGAGVEHLMGRNTYLKAEYRYSNYDQGFTRNQVVAGLGLRF